MSICVKHRFDLDILQSLEMASDFSEFVSLALRSDLVLKHTPKPYTMIIKLNFNDALPLNSAQEYGLLTFNG